MLLHINQMQAQTIDNQTSALVVLEILEILRYVNDISANKRIS